MLAILLLLATSGDRLEPQRVDVVELNHVVHHCPETGKWKLTLVQVIYWDWSEWHQCYVAQDWHVAERTNPMRQDGRWLIHVDCAKGRRLVIASAFTRSWTEYDPELDNRLIFPQGKRRPLAWR